MSASNIAGDRNSTPGPTSSSLRPPSARIPGHQLRASADMGAFSTNNTPFSSTPRHNNLRPASEVYFNNPTNPSANSFGSNTFLHPSNSYSPSNPDDPSDRAVQQWISDIDQYENTLEEMAAATLDQDFKDELSAIEQWFRVLSEPERTAALYALLQQTTQVQTRFFIQVLQQMAKNHPMASVLSPSNLSERESMASKLSDVTNTRTGAAGERSAPGGFGGIKPPASPGQKRMSGLDPSTIKSMFPDAANAIEDQKAEFEKTTGVSPSMNRSSVIGAERSSHHQHHVSISSPEEAAHLSNHRRNGSGIPSGPWRVSQTENQPPIARPKSSASYRPQSRQPMGHFGLGPPPASAGLPAQQSTGLQASFPNNGIALDSAGLPMLSPFPPGATWASLTNTPMAPNFTNNNGSSSDQQQQTYPSDLANATAMKLAAMSTVNNRIQLDDPRKFRRARSNERPPGMLHQPQGQGFPSSIVMTDELGQILSPQQAASLQQQQQQQSQYASVGARSRPGSPGIAITGPGGSTALGGGFGAFSQNNGYLSAFDGGVGQLSSGLGSLNLSQFGAVPFRSGTTTATGNFGGIPSGSSMGMSGLGGNNAGMSVMGGSIHADGGYLSDASEIPRGNTPRGRRGSSKPPEDPTDPLLLNDIPGWLRMLRLHKYTDNLKDVRWQDLVQLDEAGLEARGVGAKGARTKLLKVFDQVREAQAAGRL